MNTALQSESTVRIPVKRENEILLTMAKALDKYSPRNYGTVIGIVNGKAYCTDGFSLLRWLPEGDIGPNRVLTATLSESAVKYPGVESVLPKDSIPIRNPERFDAIRAVLKPSWKNIPMVLRIGKQSIELIPWNQKETYDGYLFNPALLVKCSKGLPKGAVCTGAAIDKEGERLTLTYQTDVGTFEILLVAIAQGR